MVENNYIYVVHNGQPGSFWEAYHPRSKIQTGSQNAMMVSGNSDISSMIYETDTAIMAFAKGKKNVTYLQIERLLKKKGYVVESIGMHPRELRKELKKIKKTSRSEVDFVDYKGDSPNSVLIIQSPGYLEDKFVDYSWR